MDVQDGHTKLHSQNTNTFQHSVYSASSHHIKLIWGVVSGPMRSYLHTSRRYIHRAEESADGGLSML
jgi:hypothetical protein